MVKIYKTFLFRVQILAHLTVLLHREGCDGNGEIWSMRENNNNNNNTTQRNGNMFLMSTPLH